MKTNNKIPLKIGYLTFLKDRLEIIDNSRIEKKLILSGFFISTSYGLWCVLSYSSLENPIIYYSGIMILLTWSFATPLLILRTYKQVLYYHEIGNINMQEMSRGDLRARFILKRGGIRLVYLNNNKKHFRQLINKLNEFHLKAEIRYLSA